MGTGAAAAVTEAGAALLEATGCFSEPLVFGTGTTTGFVRPLEAEPLKAAGCWRECSVIGTGDDLGAIGFVCPPGGPTFGF